MLRDRIFAPAVLFVAVLGIGGCDDRDGGADDVRLYTSTSRFTDPGDHGYLLSNLPQRPEDIAAVAQNLTVHHNLLPHFGVPAERWPEVRSVWPPRFGEALAALEQSGPGDLFGERKIMNRLRGACMSESHLLAGLLRSRNIPVRVRAGYFRNVYPNERHVVTFWENNARAKGVAAELFQQDPEEWRRVNHDYTRHQTALNKRIEHWITEYWDGDSGTWKRLDANTDFLKAMGDIDVGFNLPVTYFEYAHEAWMTMRTTEGFNPDQYAEWPHDGRSHIRSQLLWDFYSLLNHDIAGYDVDAWGGEDSVSTEREAYEFVKLREFEDASQEEISVLDSLAALLASEPSVVQLQLFYRRTEILHIPTIEHDSRSFVSEL